MIFKKLFFLLITVNYCLSSPCSLSCCEKKNFRSLFDCIENCTKEQHSNELRNSSVFLITYSSQSINEYSAFAIAVNLAFSEKNSYNFFIGGSNNGQNFEPADARWNKVKMLSNFLDKNASFLHEGGLVVWIDADLIFINFELDFLQIMQTYISADIVMSKDMDGSPTIANSGLMVIKKTEWSRKFVNSWWNTYDRQSCCDQNALSWLYESLPENEKQKIILLPADELNTNFPCWKNQKPENRVLHLAGATTLYRRPVFEYAWNNVCKTLTTYQSCTSSSITASNNCTNNLELITGNTKTKTTTTTTTTINYSALPIQLGLTRNKLFEFVKTLPEKRLQALQQLHQVTLDFKDKKLLNAHTIHSIGHKLEDILKKDDSENELEYHTISPQINDAITNNINPETNTKPERNLKYYVIEIKKWTYESFCYIANEFSSTLPSNNLQKLSNNNIETNSEKDTLIIYVENIRAAMSAGFELLLTLPNDEVYHTYRIQLLMDMKTNLQIPFETMVPLSLRHISLYYKYKHRDLLAIEFIQKDRLLAATYLEEALDSWEEMIALNYYGTNYVMVDPYQEGIATMQTLGINYCILNRNKEGIDILKDANDFYELTFQRFIGNILATDDIRQKTELFYADNLVNLGLCYYFSKLKSASRMNHSASYLDKALNIFKKYGIKSGKAYDSLTFYLPKIKEEQSKMT